ncbi:MAG TPA: efflux RND transporter periplasmic adaptor subunit [Candidatus Paceibacterota bacterium]|nr:efflux RND transporter periplasmic adaptor subunit [Candidatus Paceibacterota bacterium]
MKTRTIIIFAAVVVVAAAAIAWAVSRGGSQYQFVSVTQGAITETVSVTGNTTPVHSLDLAFQTGGRIAAVYRQAGDTVNAGDVLAQLDTSSLQAQLAQAQAGVAAAQATLANLQAGPTPQNIQVSQTALAAAQQTLANTYAGADNDVSSAFAKANDAVRNQISPLYTNAETNSPQLTFPVTDSQVVNNAQSQRIQASAELNAWQAELAALEPDASTSTLAQALTDAASHLDVIENFLTTVSTAVVDNVNLPAATATAYKTDVANAVTEVQSAASSISATSQSIAAEGAAVAQAQAALSVTLAGSTGQQINAQQAAVQQAQANAQQIQVEIGQASLVSPISGVVTVQNAKVGEIATAGQTVTSVISASDLEVDAYVPETDIGKVAPGDPVVMTFDAFPGETFDGKVFYIDPAETILSGVVDYEVKVSFNQADQRIKSGLTANLDIQAKTDQNALVLPQYAVIQNVSGTYVDVLQNGQITQTPVTLGIRDENGNVEITGGVTAGEQVINVGLKAQ